RAEQAVAFRLERTIVDGFRLFDFAERPGADLLRRCDRNLDLIEHRGRRLIAEGVVDQILVHGIHVFYLPSLRCAAGALGAFSNSAPARLLRSARGVIEAAIRPPL